LKLLPKTNLEEVLIKTRSKAPTSQNSLSFEQLINALDIKTQNNFDFDLIESHRIYHLDQIREVCIDYRLRFLDIKYFKNDLPESAYQAINKIETDHGTVLTEFKIMAPSALFKLERKDDPLLFVSMGNNYYYLVHKWGNDLHPLRKLLMWPFKYLESFTFCVGSELGCNRNDPYGFIHQNSRPGFILDVVLFYV